MGKKRVQQPEPEQIAGKFRDRIKEMRKVRAADLVANPLNWRTHGKEQSAAMRGILEEVGWVDALLVREIDDDPGRFEIIDGHLRATQDPDGEVPVLVLDVTAEEARKILLTFDPISAMAGVDPTNLDQLLRQVEFSESSLQALVSGVASNAGLYDGGDAAGTVEDDVPPVERTSKHARGDLWRLGKHRLLCGDSTNAEDVDRLMGGEAADMCFTDPPYNVAYQGGTAEKLKIQNDKMSDSSFREFLTDAMKNVARVLKPGGACYVCHADCEAYNFIGAYTDAGLEFKQFVIWVKNSLVLGRRDYHHRHEPILYGWKPGAAHTWNGGRKQSTVLHEHPCVLLTRGMTQDELQVLIGTQVVIVTGRNIEVKDCIDDDHQSTWFIDRPQRNAEHPTMKPVALCVRAIQNSSSRGDLVFEPFGGSGSTLSACEQIGRVCYSIELDPVYCDVIVKRWETLTGQKAILERSSENGTDGTPGAVGGAAEMGDTGSPVSSGSGSTGKHPAERNQQRKDRSRKGDCRHSPAKQK